MILEIVFIHVKEANLSNYRSFSYATNSWLTLSSMVEFIYFQEYGWLKAL